MSEKKYPEISREDLIRVLESIEGYQHECNVCGGNNWNIAPNTIGRNHVLMASDETHFPSGLIVCTAWCTNCGLIRQFSDSAIRKKLDLLEKKQPDV